MPLLGSEWPAMTPDIESVKARLLRDENTAKIAEELGVPLEEYVRQVMHFVMHPGEEPQLLVVEDDDLRRAGYEPPSAEDMGRYLEEAVSVAGLADRTDFTPAKKPPVTIGEVPVASASAASGSAGDELQSVVDSQRRAGHPDRG